LAIALSEFVWNNAAMLDLLVYFILPLGLLLAALFALARHWPSREKPHS
jgi:hypothetical protein